METIEPKTSILVKISPLDDQYIREEAGRLYGAKKGSLGKMIHRMVEVYRMHSGEQPVAT